MIRGCDTASVDGNLLPDYAKARDEGGLAFTYLRKCEHVYPDPYYPRDSARARAAGIVVGAYLMPCWTKTAVSPRAQVQAFKAAAGAIVAGHDLPPALDVESGLQGGFAATGRSKGDLVATLEEFVHEMHGEFGCWPVIYTAYTQFYDLGMPALPWAENCALWVKTAYPVPPRSPVYAGPVVEPHVGDTDDDPRSLHQIPNPWSKSGWAIHQHQGDALGFPGFSATVDLDLFHDLYEGVVDPFVAWVQRKLGVTTDGIFGPTTRQSLSQFQTRSGLSDSGALDITTFAALGWT